MLRSETGQGSDDRFFLSVRALLRLVRNKECGHGAAAAAPCQWAARAGPTGS